MTNWVTIKIPEGTRERAQEQPQTYQQIMEAGITALNGGDVERSPTSDIDTDELVSQLEDSMNELSMANDPGTDIDVGGIMAEIRKAQELAEQARDNTEEIKRGLGQ